MENAFKIMKKLIFFANFRPYISPPILFPCFGSPFGIERFRHKIRRQLCGPISVEFRPVDFLQTRAKSKIGEFDVALESKIREMYLKFKIHHFCVQKQVVWSGNTEK